MFNWFRFLIVIVKISSLGHLKSTIINRTKEMLPLLWSNKREVTAGLSTPSNSEED